MDAALRSAELSRTPRPVASRQQRALRHAQSIDEQLFQPGSWLALDRTNQVVPGVRPGTLARALELVGQGPISSFFGRLRPGVLVVDVDMVRSEGPVMALVGWCSEQGLWHVVRRSGRRGHAHVFVVVGDRGAHLEQFAAQLRAAEGVSRARIDVRTAVRPLVAPHRCDPTPPLPALGRAARALPAALAQHAPSGDQADSRPSRPAPGADIASSPRAGQVRAQRRRAGLPPAWANYLRTATVPAQVARWPDQSRSAVESCATYHMAAAGWSGEQAWVAIGTSHRAAMTKARERGRRWWLAHVWHPAIAALAGASLPTPPLAQPQSEPEAGDRELLARITLAHRSFIARWHEYGRDRRHTLRFVLETLTDRMLRVGSATVACPERDLVIDTGIRSRRTIRAALHQLHDDGWLVLHRSFQPSGTSPGDRSHHVSLPAARHGPPLSGLLPPPNTYTPLPLAARSHLGPQLWHTWTALTREPQSPTALSTASGSGPAPSPTQVATTLARLADLACLGLAKGDHDGNWVRRELVAGDPELHREAVRERAARAAAVTEERAAYDLMRQGSLRWARQRDAAVARSRAARYLHSSQWWAGLSASERESRQRHYRACYAGLTLPDQARIKDELANRRRAAGVLSEEAVRQAWRDGLAPQEYQDRVIARTMAYRALPAPLQVAYASAWASHRNRWGIQRDLVVPLSSDARQVERGDELQQLELLALTDVLERDSSGRLAGVYPPPSSLPTADAL